MAVPSTQSSGEARIRERIEATRARMSDTIEDIGAHLDPEHLKAEFRAGLREQVEETKHAARAKLKDVTHQMEETVNQTGRTLMDTIRDNPVPAAMVGVGLGWMVAEGRKHQPRHETMRHGEWYGSAGSDRSAHPAPRQPPRGYVERGYGERGYAGSGYGGMGYGSSGFAEPDPREPRYAAAGYRGHGMDQEQRTGSNGPERGGEPAERASEELRGRAEHTAERVRETASDMADRARDTTERIQETASQALYDVRERADHAKEGAERTWREAGSRAQRLEHTVERGMRENPLAAGAVMAAAGFAVGMMVPETHQEREIMGPARERFVERAQEKAEEVGDKAKHIAEETLEHAQRTSRDTAPNEGFQA